MNRHKRYNPLIFTSLFLVLVLTLSSGINAKAAVKQNAGEVTALAGITVDKNGNVISKKKTVTREEFAQMLVQASPYAGDAKNTATRKLFKDVKTTNSKASYIQIAVSKSYMRGYLGGMFKPTKAVTLKEAIYGTLGILGYTNEDFSNSSTGRYEKYKELGLSLNISKKESDTLTLTDCQNLFYNLLNAKQKSGDVYAKALGYELTAKDKIDADSLLNKKLEGPYLGKESWQKKLSSKLSTYTIYKNNKKTTSKSFQNTDIVYYSEALKTIWVYNGAAYGVVENISYSQSEPQEITIAGTTYTVETPKTMKKTLNSSSIKKGSLVAVLIGRDDKVSYLYPIEMISAYSDWKTKLGSDLSDYTVYKNDEKSSSATIATGDILYYSKSLKTAWVYNKTTFGSLDAITYNQTEPQELTVAGKSYSVDNPKNLKALIKKESIQTGMPVVLLFGWENKVADILPLTGIVAKGNWEQKLTSSLADYTIFKNGGKISSNTIESYDLVYYSNALKNIWVYDKKVYGVLNTISPSVIAPDEIVVAGKTYSLKQPALNTYNTTNSDNLLENSWGKRLRDNRLSTGDNVVVLFGYDGNVADILSVEQMPVTITGYVLSIQDKVIQDLNNVSSVKRVINIVDTEGILRDFPCTDTNIEKGSLVEINFNYGQTAIKKLQASYTISDVISRTLASNARILAVKGESYSSLTPADLKEISWADGATSYYKTNAAGEVTDVILYNIANSGYKFGILKNVTYSEYDSSAQLTFIIDGNETTLITNNLQLNLGTGAKSVLIENNEVKDIQSLTEVRISYISGKQANAGGSVYRISDNVEVYFSKDGKYYAGSLDQIKDFNSVLVNGFLEKSQGPIRVIVVSN
ncbi:hypothetical protein acsn021_01160 [Anaerocolumna cellulosilytica]|uniref:Uncharacterized protein n=1 Tax=Anaerocolumna cellulosilytica TaxID=433286 RepID=A0A6S6QXB5_9FIRM|nr:S-layer homology domain-containing protein [Anaerocolumna cellulosilytica]MBB5196134.1 phosphoribosyl-AMP cyclohydrolase [Anaerocolumna cellulosilytica]BCJ92547.1 hypothetical protein acsn021_01160 [Anaerocolumna cellulosilytica]